MVEIVFITILLVISAACGIYYGASFEQTRSEKAQAPCSSYESYSLKNIPARCVAYFVE